MSNATSRTSRPVSARLMLLPGLLLVAGGCNDASSYKSPQNLPTVPMKVGTVNYKLEIVKNDEDRMRGLMFRDSMPAEWGMIFVFPTADNTGGFWMKNTRIPLDIAYIRADGTVVSVHQMKPFDTNSTYPTDKGEYKYAIELNAGQAARNGIKAGDVLTIPPEAKDATE